MRESTKWREIHLLVGLTLLVVGSAELWLVGPGPAGLILTVAGVAIVGIEAVRWLGGSGPEVANR